MTEVKKMSQAKQVKENQPNLLQTIKNNQIKGLLMQTAKIGEDDGDSMYKILDAKNIDAVILAKLGEPKNGIRPVGKNHTKWANTMELAIRRSVILDYFRQGLSRSRIQEEICNRWYITKTMAKKYVYDALGTIAQINSQDIEEIKAIQEERFLAVAELSMQNGRFDTALRAYELVGKLYGVNQENNTYYTQINGEVKIEFE